MTLRRWVYGTVDDTAENRRRHATADDTDVTIYSLTTCGWCAKAKAFFRERGINPFVIEYDMAGPELQAKISAELRDHGAHGFPFVKIGRHVVPGYAPESYERLAQGRLSRAATRPQRPSRPGTSTIESTTRSGRRGRSVEGVLPELAGAHQHAGDADGLGGDHVAVDVVADHGNACRRQPQGPQPGGEEPGRQACP